MLSPRIGALTGYARCVGRIRAEAANRARDTSGSINFLATSSDSSANARRLAAACVSITATLSLVTSSR